MLLRQVTSNCYRKIKTPSDIPLSAELQISGTLEGVTCFRATEYVQITPEIYNTGYITLANRPSLPVGVTMMAVDGPILLNKQSNGPWADFDVFDRYVFIRNDVTVAGYTSSGLTDIIDVGDEFVISYGYSSSANLKQFTFTISNTDVSRGYSILPFRLVTPEFCMAFVVGGTTLTNRLAACATDGDFMVWGEKFIIRNNVDVGGCVSNNLSELIDVDDIIVLLYI